MQSLPVDLLIEVLLGLYLGLLTGIVPAFVAGSLGFLVRYFTGVTLPGFGVVVLALSIASVQGGLLGLVEPTIAQSPRLLVAVLVVLMLALYAHNQGDKLGAELPRRLSFTRLRQRTLSADVVELVGSVGQVTVRPTGEIRNMEGYPPLSATLRQTLKSGSWRLPADLPLSELESRLEERLRTDHDLADVDVAIDEQGRATITAAPPSGSLSRRVAAGQRAVSIATLVPTGLGRGDEVTVRTGERSIAGTVVSARTDIDDEHARAPVPDDPPAELATDGGADVESEIHTAKPTAATAGGPGRVTVSVARRDVKAVLEADSPRLVVRSRGTSREFEAFALVKREGYAVRRITVGTSDAADESADLEDPPSTGTVSVLAVRRQGSETGGRSNGWVFGPGIERRLEPDDEAFLAGPDDAIEAFAEAIAR
ncbi:potassium transporter TrkA [Natrinema longum]|uniref:Potassium transporter TrkA n=1 Tax=Natrinema longum TaxID=370324 RepID=A0A8A2U6F9_9EURY|nr:potassium transporter TrkA [Natrinema longum]MBZ6494461.1 potassium transporter TrkA [Natrinema longum]QSW84216.1 potassium transporter TrkA [Natrinema longum]